MALSTALKKKLLKNTGFFEGNNGYSTIVGNFDGQGISFGIIQYNLGQETLQPLLNELIDNNYNTVVKCFGKSKAKTLKDVIKTYSKKEQLTWANNISTSKGNVKDAWKTCFEALGKEQCCINLQIKYAASYFNRALKFASSLGITSTQGLAYLFDQAVQEWSFSKSISTMQSSIDGYKQARGNAWNGDSDILLAIHTYIRTEDGKTRREAIRNGGGIVHGKTYHVSDFNLSYNEYF